MMKLAPLAFSRSKMRLARKMGGTRKREHPKLPRFGVLPPISELTKGTPSYHAFQDESVGLLCFARCKVLGWLEWCRAGVQQRTFYVDLFLAMRRTFCVRPSFRLRAPHQKPAPPSFGRSQRRHPVSVTHLARCAPRMETRSTLREAYRLDETADVQKILRVIPRGGGGCRCSTGRHSKI